MGFIYGIRFENSRHMPKTYFPASWLSDQSATPFESLQVNLFGEIWCFVDWVNSISSLLSRHGVRSWIDWKQIKYN